jgi:hypothetical protein
MPSQGVNLGLFRRCLKRLDFYIFVPLTVIFFTCLYGYNTPYILWLKSQPAKYSILTVNNLGTVSSAVAVVSAITVLYYTDLEWLALGGCRPSWSSLPVLEYCSYGLECSLRVTLLCIHCAWCGAWHRTAVSYMDGRSPGR